MFTPKFFTFYNYQKEIFSILINASQPFSELNNIELKDYLVSNRTIFSPSGYFNLYKYSSVNTSDKTSKPLNKFGIVNDFDDYLISCSKDFETRGGFAEPNAPCVNISYILNANQNSGVYFTSLNTNTSNLEVFYGVNDGFSDNYLSFYDRCKSAILNYYIYNKVDGSKELNCVYEKGIVESSYFIKDLGVWKHEYIDYYLCGQEDISLYIDSIFKFNKFKTEVDDVSSARTFGNYIMMHSFIPYSEYNRKNIISKIEYLLKKHFYRSSDGYYFDRDSKVIDYSVPPVGELNLEGKNGANLHVQYFNSINFYTKNELIAFNTSFDSRPLYLKNEDSKYSPIYDIRGKTSEPIILPPAKFDSKGFPIKRYVRVTKLSPETRSSLIGREISLEKITEVVPNNFSYPFSAIVATKIDSRSMSNLPARSFDCKLKKVLIPSNYYPLDNMGRDLRYSKSRGAVIIYKGVWDGTFKLGWTDNPAWILMDLLINKRYGLGNYIQADQIDIWELYQIAKWCDACDDNGIFWGVPDTYSGYEPRYTFNALISEKYNVYDMINNIMSIFNGAVFYSNSIISFDDNRLKDISGTISATDVTDGLFNFANFKKDDEFTVIEVAFLDKRDSFKTKIEYVEDSEAIRKRGILKKQVNPMGITSRGQAIRYAKNILFQTAKESSNVSFSIDSKILSYGIGDLIRLNTDIEDKKHFGKILQVCRSFIGEVILFIDSCLSETIFDTSKIDIFTRKQFSNEKGSYFDLEKCTYFIKCYFLCSDSLQNCGTSVYLKDEETVCNSINYSTQDINYNECFFNRTFKYIQGSEFNETSTYSLRKKEKKDKIYKIASITENSASEFSVFATEYCSTKFDIIEGESPKDINTDNYFYIVNKDESIIDRPKSVYFSDVEIVPINSLQKGIKVTWKALPNIVGYNLYILSPNTQKQILARTITGTSPIISGIQIGGYDAIKKEYFYIFLQSISSIGTYQLGIESYILENAGTKRTSEMTFKSITL